MTEQDIAKAKAEARTAAEKRLREAHAEEMRQYMIEEHENRGLEYRPRLSKEEKAREDILRLAKEHGIALTFQVETAEDATANEEIMQSGFARSEQGLGQRLQAEAAEREIADQSNRGLVVDAPSVY